MNEYRGLASIVIGGQQRSVKFGTNATREFCKLRKINIHEYTRLINAAVKAAAGEEVHDVLMDGAEVRDLVWAGLVAGGHTSGKPFELSPEWVGDEIEIMEQAELDKAFEAYAKSLSPNGQRAKQEKTALSPS